MAARLVRDEEAGSSNLPHPTIDRPRFGGAGARVASRRFGTRGGYAPRMRTRCERRRCTAVATAAIAVDPPNQTVWIGDLEGSAPHVTVFCTACADALLVPSGWHRRDVREAPRLFGDRVMPWEKAAAELAAKGRDGSEGKAGDEAGGTAPAPKGRRAAAKPRVAAEGTPPKEPSKRATKAPRAPATRSTGTRRTPAADPAQQRFDDVAAPPAVDPVGPVDAAEPPPPAEIEETPPAPRLLAVMPAEAQQTDEPLLNPSEATPLLARAFNQHRRTR